MSKTQCQAKGYTKAKKIEDIKKHFYSSSKQSNAGNLQSSLSRKPFSTLISLPRTVRVQPASQSLRVPPWGGGGGQFTIATMQYEC